MRGHRFVTKGFSKLNSVKVFLLLQSAGKASFGNSFSFTTVKRHGYSGSDGWPGAMDGKRSLTNDVFDSDSDPESSPLPSKQRPRGPVVPQVCLLQPPHNAEASASSSSCYTARTQNLTCGTAVRSLSDNERGGQGVICEPKGSRTFAGCRRYDACVCVNREQHRRQQHRCRDDSFETP